MPHEDSNSTFGVGGCNPDCNLVRRRRPGPAALQGYLLAGFTDSSPEWGIGMTATRRF